MEIEDVKNESIDLDQDLQKEEIYNFLDKTTLVGKVVKATIVGLYPSHYKEMLMALTIDGKELRTHINKTHKNFFVSVFGAKPRNWIGKVVYVSGQKNTYNIEGNQVEGVALTFSV